MIFHSLWKFQTVPLYFWKRGGIWW